MTSHLSRLLHETIERELPHLHSLSEEASLIRPRGESSWSPKEELGHLIDSAANNHQRFVRGSLQDEYRGPGYAQNDWVAINGYRETPWQQIISMWFEYNSLLVRTLANIPENKLTTPCFIGSAEEPATLGFVAEDYVLHMQHHIDHLLKRQVVTQYPSAAKQSASPVAR